MGGPSREEVTARLRPAAPLCLHHRGFEQRRELWVKEVKGNPLYNPSIGEALRIVAPVDGFDYANYKTELRNVMGSSPKTVSGKYGKARGKADGIIIRAHKVGTTTFAEVGRFTATPFNVLIPMTGTDPETREIQGQVFAKDQPFGLPSDIVEVIVKP